MCQVASCDYYTEKSQWLNFMGSVGVKLQLCWSMKKRKKKIFEGVIFYWTNYIVARDIAELLGTTHLSSDVSPLSFIGCIQTGPDIWFPGDK